MVMPAPPGAGPILVKAIEEASGRLVGPPVFKTGEGSKRPLAGSIPVRLRHHLPAIGHSSHCIAAWLTDSSGNARPWTRDRP